MPSQTAPRRSSTLVRSALGSYLRRSFLTTRTRRSRRVLRPKSVQHSPPRALLRKVPGVCRARLPVRQGRDRGRHARPRQLRCEPPAERDRRRRRAKGHEEVGLVRVRARGLEGPGRGRDRHSRWADQGGSF